MRAAAPAALLLVVAGFAGCGDGRFESASDETRIVGTLAGSVRHRPNEGIITIPIRVRPDRVEFAVLPESPRGKRPSDEFIDVYRTSTSMLLGDRLIATGTRNEHGILVVDKVEVQDRARPYSTPKSVGGPFVRIAESRSGADVLEMALQQETLREEVVLVPTAPGGSIPEATAAELRQQLDTLQAGDWVVALGARNAAGVLVVAGMHVRDP